MKKKIIILVVLLFIAAGAVFAYLELKDEKLEVSNDNVKTEEVSKTIIETETPDGAWKITATEDVFAGYEIDEVFGGDSISKTAVGKSNGVSGVMKIDGNIISGISITVDMTKLESDSSGRDSKMSNEGLETNNFPEALFEQTEDLTLSSAPTKGETISVEVVGNLTIHGVTKSVTFKLQTVWDGKTITATGEQEINLVDYDIEAPNNSFVKVEDKGLVKLQLLLIPA